MRRFGLEFALGHSGGSYGAGLSTALVQGYSFWERRDLELWHPLGIRLGKRAP